ncbi:MAG: undecaprenyl-diphosphatase UppP [Lentisphaeria bacterium]|nr:undecaprenyl-diphosphatase UppP [Lentisphaeria bacterium]
MEVIWKAALLGLVQGITEFLPVSSSAHLLLLRDLLDLDHGSFVKFLDILIQFASVLAMVVYFFRTLFPPVLFRVMFTGSFKKHFELCRSAEMRPVMDLWQKIALGFLPIAVIGFIAAKLDWKDALDEQPWVRVGALLVGGILLLRVERWCRHEHPAETIAELSFRAAMLIGLAQCLAIIPGMSRMASTIIAALALGAARPVAAEYSFMLAIPTMFGASAYSLLKFLKSGTSLSTNEGIALAVGVTVSFLVSLSVISWLMRFIKKHTFEPFGWYRIALAAAVACWLLLD